MIIQLVVSLAFIFISPVFAQETARYKQHVALDTSKKDVSFTIAPFDDTEKVEVLHKIFTVHKLTITNDTDRPIYVKRDAYLRSQREVSMALGTAASETFPKYAGHEGEKFLRTLIGLSPVVLGIGAFVGSVYYTNKYNLRMKENIISLSLLGALMSIPVSIKLIEVLLAKFSGVIQKYWYLKKINPFVTDIKTDEISEEIVIEDGRYKIPAYHGYTDAVLIDVPKAQEKEIFDAVFYEEQIHSNPSTQPSP